MERKLLNQRTRPGPGLTPAVPQGEGACRYQSLRRVAILLEAWGLGGGPGKTLLSKWFEYFQLCPVLCPATPSAQHPIHPVTHQPLPKGSPQGSLQFSTGRCSYICRKPRKWTEDSWPGTGESGWDPGGAVDPRRGSSWNLISWEWGLGWWEVLRTGSLLTSPRKTPNTFPLSACSVPRIKWPLTSAHSLTTHFPHVWEPQCKKDVYGFQLTAVPTVAMGEALALGSWA